MPRVVKGHVAGEGRRVGVIVSRFNEAVTARLLDGSLRALADHGVRDDRITVVHVPGAVEIPLAALRLAQSGRKDALVALGAVIRGETDHYDSVCRMVERGVLEVMLRTGMPIGFGVLTCSEEEQADARSGPGKDNKGYEAVLAVLEMAGLLSELRA